MRVCLVFALFACLLAAVPAAHAGVRRSFVGVYDDDAAESAAEARLGVGLVRRPFEWSQVERTPGAYDWSRYDSDMELAARAGMSVMPVLIAPPAFRSSRPASSTSRAMYPPRSNAAYAAWVAAAVGRYGPRGTFWRDRPSLPFLPIHSWQVWNEPNIPNFWRSGVSAKAYVALLRAAARAIRRADPNAEVVAAGLPNSHLGQPFLAYLNAMYAAGAKGLFDTLAIHPYSRDVAGLLALTERARLVMDRWGDRSRLWITEFGWSTGGGASAFRVSEPAQAARIAAAVSALYAERRALRLRGFVLFKWRDWAPPAGSVSDPWPLHAGLLGADGTPKPGFWAFASEVRAIHLAPSAWPASAAAPSLTRRSFSLSPLGFADVPLACASPAFGACGGRVVLQTAEPLACGGVALARGALIGAARFEMAAPTALVPVRLSRAAQRAARCTGSLGARVPMGVHSVALTIRAR